MMQYSRLGIIYNQDKKSKIIKDKKGVDYVNIFLFILLIIVALLFIFT